nr:hypothetical protein [Sphingomonas sp. G-3-2-10]
MHGANLWPERAPELRLVVEEYLAATIAAAKALMRGLAIARRIALGRALHPRFLPGMRG